MMLITGPNVATTEPERLVLCYHAVDPDWPCELAVEPDAFEAQVVRLLDQGYEPKGFTETVNTTRPTSKTLAITFDDGYRSVATYAAPILRDLGAVATIFVVTDFVSQPGPMSWAGIDQWTTGGHRDALQPISWSALADLVADGWEVGSHSVHHAKLTFSTDAELHGELVGSKAAIEDHLQVPCRSLAYPFGDVDPRVMAATAGAGYLAAAGLHPIDDRPSTMNWPRVSVYPIDSPMRFRIKTSQAVRRGRQRLLRRRTRVPAT